MNPIKFPDLSIDIETLGLPADSVIIQIALQEFNADTGELGACQVIYPNEREQMQVGRHINFDTLSWWLKANRELFGQILEAPKMGHSEAKAMLLATMSPARSYWFKHPMSDMTILNSYYNIEQELRAWDRHAYRRIKDIATLGPALLLPAPAFEGTPHDAQADARNQALWVIDCMRWIRNAQPRENES